MRRKTSQYLIPILKNNRDASSYDIYPSFPIEKDAIQVGYATLAKEISKEATVILEGYIGVDWDEVCSSIRSEFQNLGINPCFINITDFLKPEDEIKSLIEPYLGGDDPIFGRRASIELSEYFDTAKITNLALDARADINIVYGAGASASGFVGFLVYFDLPKNELQSRLRANVVTNLDLNTPKDHKQMYKHFYFLDWPILKTEKKKLLPYFSIIVNQLRLGKPVCGESLREGLSQMSKSAFRVRPWFEPGILGWQWMKDRAKT